MSTTLNQLDSFHRFETERALNAEGKVTIDELFELWREENTTSEGKVADRLAVEAALQDMKNGDTGQPFDDFDREFRKRNAI